MECLISVVQSDGPRLVRVAGRLSEAQVPDLLCVSAPEAGLVQIDLEELMSADGVGLEALHRLRTSGARIVNAPALHRSRWTRWHKGRAAKATE
jgi:hypothetical protein